MCFGITEQNSASDTELSHIVKSSKQPRVTFDQRMVE